jgi:hypothetical protein
VSAKLDTCGKRVTVCVCVFCVHGRAQRENEMIYIYINIYINIYI